MRVVIDGGHANMSPHGKHRPSRHRPSRQSKCHEVAGSWPANIRDSASDVSQKQHCTSLDSPFVFLLRAK